MGAAVVVLASVNMAHCKHWQPRASALTEVASGVTGQVSRSSRAGVRVTDGARPAAVLAFFGEAVLTMELPRRHATPLC